MEESKLCSVFFDLLKVALWNTAPSADYSSLTEKDWALLYEFSGIQGTRALMFDGVAALGKDRQPDESLMLQWAVYVKMMEAKGERNTRTLIELNKELKEQGLEMLLLKGKSLSECYPPMKVREYGDIDIFLFNGWEAGNDFLSRRGPWLETTYKHSVYLYKGVMVENHRRFVKSYASYDIFARKRKTAFDNIEQTLRGLLDEDPILYIQNTDVRIASPTFNFLFLLMHAGGHFVGSVIVRQLCDWACFLVANKGKYDERLINKALDHLNFRKLCFLFTDAAIRLIGMPIEYAPSFYEPEGREIENDKLAEDISRSLKRLKENPKKTFFFKLKAFRDNQWKDRLFLNESLLERLIRYFPIWLKNRFVNLRKYFQKKTPAK